MAKADPSPRIRKRPRRIGNSLKILGIVGSKVEMGVKPQAKPKSLYW